jgi:hypothetical protein
MQPEAEVTVILCNLTFNQPTHPCIESLYPLYDDCNYDIVLGEHGGILIIQCAGINACRVPSECWLKSISCRSAANPTKPWPQPCQCSADNYKR